MCYCIKGEWGRCLLLRIDMNIKIIALQVYGWMCVCMFRDALCVCACHSVSVSTSMLMICVAVPWYNTACIVEWLCKRSRSSPVHVHLALVWQNFLPPPISMFTPPPYSYSYSSGSQAVKLLDNFLNVGERFTKPYICVGREAFTNCWIYVHPFLNCLVAVLLMSNVVALATH